MKPLHWSSKQVLAFKVPNSNVRHTHVGAGGSGTQCHAVVPRRTQDFATYPYELSSPAQAALVWLMVSC